MAGISRSSGDPRKKLAFGAFLLLLWVGAAAFTILTTEELIKGHDGSGVFPSWQILVQLWDVVQGKYGGIEVIAILGAWIAFSTYMVISALEWMTDGGASDRIYQTVCWIIILIDSYANWNYLRILPRPEYQWLMVFGLFLTIAFAGKKGFGLILESLAEIGGA